MTAVDESCSCVPEPMRPAMVCGFKERILNTVCNINQTLDRIDICFQCHFTRSTRSKMANRLTRRMSDQCCISKAIAAPTRIGRSACSIFGCKSKASPSRKSQSKVQSGMSSKVSGSVCEPRIKRPLRSPATKSYVHSKFIRTSYTSTCGITGVFHHLLE